MTQAVYATPTLPLALDGLGRNTTCQYPILCDWQLLNTTKGNDVIIVVVLGDQPISIIDSSGLSFSQRLSYTTSGLSEYYARATSPLRSDNITVIGSPFTQVLAISGANTRAIFDPNPSIPAMCSQPNCGDCTVYYGTCSVSMQTSTIDFVVATTAINDAGACGGYLGSFGGVPGFTTITTNNGYSGNFEIDYTITAMPQTKVVFNCNGTEATEIVVDAISFRGAFGI